MILNVHAMTFCRNLWQHTTRKMSDAKVSTAEKVSGMNPNEMVKNMVKVSDWNKRLLVFAGRFKKLADIPENLPFEVIDKARNKARIKVANYMMVLTLAGCALMVVSGKRAAERGETVSEQNLDWHRQYNTTAAVKEGEAVKQ